MASHSQIDSARNHSGSKSILECLDSDLIGQTFFDRLAEELAQCLNADHVLIAELDETMTTATTVSYYMDGEFAKNMQYELSGTPCSTVQEKTSWIYSERLRERYPDDRPLFEHRIESYACAAITNDRKKPVGLVAIMRRKPMEDSDCEKAMTALSIAARRSFTELAHRRERASAENEIAALRNTLSELKAKSSCHKELTEAFIRNVNHEIRTPLTAILGATELLGYDDLSNEEKSHYLNTIKSSGDSLAQGIKDLIEISQIQAKEIRAEKACFPIESFLKETLLLWQRAFLPPGKQPPCITLRQGAGTLEGDLVYTDKKLLRNALRPVVDNALKFGNKGKILLSASARNGVLEIAVSDNGIGIPDTFAERIFEPFFQIDSKRSRKYNGLGLGLAIAHGLVDALGGHIKVMTQGMVEKGSVFLLQVPCGLSPGAKLES